MVSDLSTIFYALADPTRRAIVARLSVGDAPVKALVEPFAMSGPAITKHLKVLERAGLISRSREGQQRPCRLEPSALATAADWIDQYRAMWEERFDRLDAFLQGMAQQAAQPAVRHRQGSTAPPKQRAARKTTARKTTARKTTARKISARKTTARKTAQPNSTAAAARAQKPAGRKPKTGKPAARRPQGGRHGHSQ